MQAAASWVTMYASLLTVCTLVGRFGGKGARSRFQKSYR